MKPSNPPTTSRPWIILLIATVLITYFLVLMEWLFFVTKQSFMTGLGTIDILRVLLVAPIPLVITGAAGIFLCWIPAAAARNRAVRTACLAVGLAIPAFILACTAFLLIDNFTYTVLRFGVRSTRGAQRYIYGLLVLVLFVSIYRILHKYRIGLFRPAAFRITAVITLCILCISILAAAFTCNTSELAALKWRIIAIPLERRPNIILLSSDGLEAGNMSIYGYHRDTTPFLSGLSYNALLCENAFTNADASGASIASMFTGKLPTQTKLVFPPDILKGEDAFQHLPGILKKHGYRTIDISVRHHADPIDLNMLDAFDWANFRRISKPFVSVLMSSLFSETSFYLLQKIRDRLTDRLLHAFGAHAMEDPLAEVEKPEREEIKDADRIKSLFECIDASSAPFFAHVHLLGTHGPKFFPAKQNFSAGQKQYKEWMPEFYDDAVLHFDSQIKMITGGLRERGILDNTVIVVCTDHGRKWNAFTRVPLIFLFPDGEHSGRITANAQNLDISSTILDYLGIEQPEWMGGLSLLSPEVESSRAIFILQRKIGLITVTKEGKLVLSKRKTKPPFYAIRCVSVVYCHKIFKLYVERSRLIVSDIKGHTSPCDGAGIPDPKQVGRLIIDHLKENNYDTSSIRTPLFIGIVR